VTLIDAHDHLAFRQPLEHDPEKWIRQIYAAVSQAGHAARIDAFNRTYGLMRGFTIAALVLGVIFLIFGEPKWFAAAAFVFAALAFFQFFLSAISYARELFAQFLILQPKS
jgi:hypothetical protein